MERSQLPVPAQRQDPIIAPADSLMVPAEPQNRSTICQTHRPAETAAPMSPLITHVARHSSGTVRVRRTSEMFTKVKTDSVTMLVARARATSGKNNTRVTIPAPTSTVARLGVWCFALTDARPAGS